jgi:hypothetical protein
VQGFRGWGNSPSGTTFAPFLFRVSARDVSSWIVASFLRSTSAPRDRRWFRVPAAWLLALTLVCTVTAVPVAGAGAWATAEDPPALSGRLRSIRTAFLANSPEQALQCFVRDRSVYVQMLPLVRGGFLGPGSLDAFVRRMFSERVSVAFTVGDGPPVAAEASRAFVTAAWTYRSTASSTLHVDHLHLVLSHAPEHAEWLIVEMKTSSR